MDSVNPANSPVLNQVRYRYQKSDGTPVWLPFDPDFSCIYCNAPVNALTKRSGPAVCPFCDCQVNFRGMKWGPDEAKRRRESAKLRLDSLPSDPAWKVYEQYHKERNRG